MNDDVQTFIEASGATAIFAIVRADGVLSIGQSINPSAEKLGQGDELAEIMWVWGHHRATIAVAQVVFAADQPRARSLIARDRARAAFAALTPDLEAAPHGLVIQRAVRQVEKIDAQLQSTGVIRDLNRQYKKFRQAGAKVGPYPVWLQARRREMIIAAAGAMTMAFRHR